MNDSPPPVERSPEMEKAEEMVDTMAETVASYAARLRLNLIKSVALAREEAEDIWAEAKELSQQRHA